MRRKLILALLTALLPVLCAAQDNLDCGTWMSVTGTHKFGDADLLQLRGEWRTQDCCSSTNQVYGRLRYGHKFTGWLELDMFGDYAWTPSGDKWRYGPAALFSWKTGELSYTLREWWFRSYSPTSDATTDNARTILTVTWQREGVIPYVAGECFGWPGEGISQWRSFAGLKFAVGGSSTLNAFCLYQAFPPKNKALHILGLGWSFNI